MTAGSGLRRQARCHPLRDGVSEVGQVDAWAWIEAVRRRGVSARFTSLPTSSLQVTATTGAECAGMKNFTGGSRLHSSVHSCEEVAR